MGSKSDRAKAIKAELAKRQAERIQSCPISFEEMLALKVSASTAILSDEVVKGFDATKEWALQNRVVPNPLLTFLESQGIHSDWDVAISADPFQMFGPRNGRHVHMPLSESQLDGLLDYVDELVESKGCDHDFTHTKKFLASNNLNSPELLMCFIALGGGCDCELVLNVESEGIYT